MINKDNTMVENNKIFSFLSEDLDGLEKYLKDFCEGLEGVLKSSVKAILLAGGKRIRPALFFICARGAKHDLQYLLPAAAAIEIIHTASLIHDDIIDRAIIRRDKQTIHTVYDRDTAKFVGNYLFTQTFDLLNKYGNPELLREMSIAAQNLVRGEFDQIKTRKLLSQRKGLYMRKINEKTSSLFKVSCVLGGILSGSSKKDIKNMRKFGEYLGASFQINDDLLDIGLSRSGDSTGKPVGNDLKQGNITLPVIFALRRKNFSKKIRTIFEKNNIGNSEVEKILSILSETDAIKKTQKYLDYYLCKALKVIQSIENSEKRDGLTKICNFL